MAGRDDRARACVMTSYVSRYSAAFDRPSERRAEISTLRHVSFPARLIATRMAGVVLRRRAKHDISPLRARRHHVVMHGNVGVESSRQSVEAAAFVRYGINVAIILKSRWRLNANTARCNQKPKISAFGVAKKILGLLVINACWGHWLPGKNGSDIGRGNMCRRRRRRLRLIREGQRAGVEAVSKAISSVGRAALHDAVLSGDRART